MTESEDRKLAQLLAASQQGDQAAYSEFLSIAAAKLRPYISRRVSSCHDPEDIVQESLLTLHRARHSYTPGRPVGPWIYAICESRIVDAFRKRSRRFRIENALENIQQILNQPNQISSSQLVTEDPRLDRVIELLKRLPERQRQIIELIKLHELSVAKVSSLTGLSQSAVKVYAFRGYQSLRRSLGLETK